MASCQEENEVPNTPELTYLSEEVKPSTEAGIPDSLAIIFDFVDGDGDIGTASEDNPDCLGDPDIEVYTLVAENNIFVRLPNAEFNSCFESITPPGQNKLLEGEMTVFVPLIPQGAETGDSIKTTIQLRDRAGNVSNIIETPLFLVD